jgi:hypothetical protein
LEKCVELLNLGKEMSVEIMNICMNLSFCGNSDVRKKMADYLMPILSLCLLSGATGGFDRRGLYALATLVNICREKKTASMVISGRLIPTLVQVANSSNFPAATASLQARISKI